MSAPRKAFYRYFDSIDDVLDALLDYEYLESMKEVVNQNYEPFFTGPTTDDSSMF